jgi:hypothetical protein
MRHDLISIFSLNGHEPFSRSAEEIHHVSFHWARSYPEGCGCESGKYRSLDRRTHDMIPTSDFGVEVRTISRVPLPSSTIRYMVGDKVLVANACCYPGLILTISIVAHSRLPSKITLSQTSTTHHGFKQDAIPIPWEYGDQGLRHLARRMVDARRSYRERGRQTDDEGGLRSRCQLFRFRQYLCQTDR